jgi:hypothetical protein
LRKIIEHKGNWNRHGETKEKEKHGEEKCEPGILVFREKSLCFQTEG